MAQARQMAKFIQAYLGAEATIWRAHNIDNCTLYAYTPSAMRQRLRGVARGYFSLLAMESACLCADQRRIGA